MRHVLIGIFVLTTLVVSAVARAQSTISDRACEVLVGNGMWVSSLPDYELGTTGGGTTAIRDSLDDVGYYGDIKAIRRFLGTRTSFEARGFYGYSGSRSTFDVSDIDIPSPLDGGINSFSGGSSRFSSDTDHYGYDIGLRDTWRTRFGGISGAALFSFMAFDQTFDLDYGGSRLMSEQLNSDYIGGKGVFGWDGLVFGRPSTLDIAIGFYQLRADYRFEGGSISGFRSNRMYKKPVTVEAIFSRYHACRGFQVGVTAAATYLSEMPRIDHNQGSTVSLGSDDGFLFRLMFEILL
jgi:hypothetical protein